MKHGWDSFTFTVVDITPRDKGMILACEQRYLDEEPYYNLLPVAASSLGFKHSPESREKMGWPMRL
jgi:hypothetical protein